MSIMMYMLRNAIRHSPFAPKTATEVGFRASSSNDKPVTPRVAELRKKLEEKTPSGKLAENIPNAYQEKEPLEKYPNSVNPKTGEIGGPSGPEPTRYGDWERKGRVSDF